MIACARMYAVSPAVADAWRRLFAWVAERARVSLAVVDHPAPAPLGDLWARPDMACVFMCGLPLARRSPAPHPVAAPVASPPRYGGRAAYFTDFVVRADAAWTRLEDTFGTRFAFTTEDSHSGYNAARFHLLAHRRPARPALYRRVLGPYVTPRRVLDAVLSGEADVAPLDSYVLDLLRRHATHAGDHVIFGRKVLAKQRPRRAGVANGEVADDRPALADREAHPQLAPAIALPGDGEQTLGDRRGQSF